MFALVACVAGTACAAGAACAADPAPDVPVIAFLSRDEAGKAIVEEKIEPYFTLLSALDMSAKTGSAIAADNRDAQLAEVKTRYREAMRDFTDAEKEALTAALTRLQPTLKEHYPLFARTPWSLIKKASSLEGGAHFTREAHIVLSEQFPAAVASAREKRKPDEVARMALGLLLHEQCHVLQRLHPKLFAGMYAQFWRMERFEKIAGTTWLDERNAVNPDGVDVNWIVPVKMKEGDAEVERHVWPRILYKTTQGVPRMFADMEMVLVDVERAGEGWRVKSGDDGTPSRQPLNKAASFAALFPHGNAYHPNEAAAAAIPAIILADAFPQAARPAPSQAMLDYEGRLRKWMREKLK